jgi:hypothetical protein
MTFFQLVPGLGAFMHKACYCTLLEDGKMLCILCPHDCRIPDRKHGISHDCGAPIEGVGMV